MQAGPKSVKARTPDHAGAGSGGRQRSGPTGGTAYGMPLNTRTAPSMRPSSTPAGACTIGAGVEEDMGGPCSAHEEDATANEAAAMPQTIRRPSMFINAPPQGGPGA